MTMSKTLPGNSLMKATMAVAAIKGGIIEAQSATPKAMTSLMPATMALRAKRSIPREALPRLVTRPLRAAMLDVHTVLPRLTREEFANQV